MWQLNSHHLRVLPCGHDNNPQAFLSWNLLLLRFKFDLFLEFSEKCLLFNFSLEHPVYILIVLWRLLCLHSLDWFIRFSAYFNSIHNFPKSFIFLSNPVLKPWQLFSLFVFNKLARYPIACHIQQFLTKSSMTQFK